MMLTVSIPAVSSRDGNLYRILHLLRLHPGISRIDIVRRTGLGKATVSELVADLICDGLVSEERDAAVRLEPEVAKAGRRPVGLRLCGSARLAVGVELTGNELVLALTDLYANPLRIERHPILFTGVEDIVELIAASEAHLVEGYDESRVLGVGVGVPGVVDGGRQVVLRSIPMGWLDVPLAALLEKRLSKPVTIVKRQQAGALGEYWHGIGKGTESLIFISVGNGIGSGIIVHGEVYQGSGGSAGEIGHMTVVPDGYRCKCGNTGCLETVASLPAIEIRARELIKRGRSSSLLDVTRGIAEGITATMVFEAAEQGDSLAGEVVGEAACCLGIAVANLLNLFNPSMVLLGGEMFERGDLFLRQVLEAVHQRALSGVLSAVTIARASLGSRAAAIGATTLVIDRFFAPVDLLSQPDTWPTVHELR
jgi:glucokinase-like ROK family protein